MSAGLDYLAAVVASGDIKCIMGDKFPEGAFRVSEQEAYDKLIGHVRKYGAIPQKDLVEQWYGDDLPPVKEPPAYYKDQVMERYVHKTLTGSMKDAKKYLTTNAELDPYKALEMFRDEILKLSITTASGQIVDFRDAVDIIVPNYKQKLIHGDEMGIPTGWEYLDEQMQGLLPGDVLSIVGRPAMGKTFKMLFMMHYAWWRAKKRTLFVSMEMNPLVLTQRTAAMHTHKNLSHLMHSELSTKGFNGMVKELTLAKDHPVPCWIVDGNLSASVEDIWILAQQLKPEAIYIDGAYLLTHPNQRLDRYTKVAENCELMKKALAGHLGIPVSASWQFSREAAKKTAKKKEGEKPGLEDIGYTDAIGQISSVVLGLLEAESVETIQRRLVTMMKGRSGEVGEFFINWDFNVCNFSQWKEPEVQDLQFI